ncbi:MAG: DAK2 domain-containing protein [Paenibacillaceae bacterium]
MLKHNLDGTDFMNMIWMGAKRLQENIAWINGLNVFPVPDGDTGTNMYLTLQSGIVEMKAKASSHLGQASEALSRGLLLGARGNSGVILSQLFRGFAKSVIGLEQANIQQLSAALLQGVETAYQAVVKPVEGTILTVSRQAAKYSEAVIGSTDNIVELFQGVQCAAQAALTFTPEQLPILKQAGVVDAGGQGLVYIYEGIVQALSGESQIDIMDHPIPSSIHRTNRAQSHIATEDIEFGYCTEFIIRLRSDSLTAYNELAFREELGRLGDSLLVVTEDDLVKVHIHAEQPGTVMNHAMQFGDLTRIKIENMREQHLHILDEDENALSTKPKPIPVVSQNKAFGMLAVAVGDGISSLFSSLGVDIVLVGGQSMNPSTEDLLLAMNRVPANLVYIFPNNPNITLAAMQAGQLAGKEVIIIPSKTIPQGVAAVLSFNENLDVAANEAAMVSAMEQVRSGSITFAVRDSKLDQLEIHEHDFLGMMDNLIVVSDPNPYRVSELLLDRLIERGDELVTLYYGEEADSEWTQAIQTYIENNYPYIELEIHSGGQPLYYYIISVE